MILAEQGGDDSVDTRVITDIARYFRKQIGHDIPRQQPFVGSHFNTTLSGIHADALSKDRRIYTIFDTEAILGVPPDVRITDKCGRAGVAYWINLNLELTGGDRVDKGHPGVAEIVKKITDQYERGRITIMSEEEMAGLVAAHMPGLADRARAMLD